MKHNYIKFVLLYLIGAILDLGTTLIGLSLGFTELNPIANQTLQLGPFGIAVYKTALTYILVYLAYRYWHKKLTRYFAYGGLALLMFTVLNNFIQVF